MRKLICRILSDEGYHTEGVENGQDALAWLDVVMPSLVILDYRLPDMSGKEVIEAMRARQRQVPFVVITGHGDERVAVEMMKLGAADYLVKDEAFLDLLPSVARQVIQALSNERLLKESEEELAAKENRFVELFNHIHSGVAVFEAIDAGKDFVFLDVNPALEKIEGVDGAELLGQRLSRKAPYLCGEMISALLQRVYRTGRGESREGVPCQGPYGERWLDVQVYRLATGEVVLVYAD
ncbi:MAG: response regulator, partial [Desulfuromonadales bacterium]|nr:response regulator [Desulfuromonadales bacterium]